MFRPFLYRTEVHWTSNDFMVVRQVERFTVHRRLERPGVLVLPQRLHYFGQVLELVGIDARLVRVRHVLRLHGTPEVGVDRRRLPPIIVVSIS